MLDFPSHTVIVCHDAGAANIIIASLLNADRRVWRAYMHGPAEKLWKAAFPENKLYQSLVDALDEAELVVTGTGWGSDVEHDARRLARSMGVKSIAVIDHWVNYAERFVRRGEVVWPDEFWVTDDYAMNIAKNVFPNLPVLQVPNYYVEMQLREIKHIQKPCVPELLYVLEPARNTWGRAVQGEFQALDYFAGALHGLELPSETIIRIRPHPSDPGGKYDDWIALHPELNIQIDKSLSITESIGRASWVVGCESFALVLAMLAGCKVYCSLPPWAPKCRLPHGELLQLIESNK